MAQEGGGEWYQSINFNKLSCRQVSVFGPKGTPSREEHKTPVHFYLPRGELQVWRIFLFNLSVRDRQSKQSARPSLQSSELAPPLHPHSSVAPPPPLVPKRGGHTS
jgi:hypothetical protein